MFDRSYAELMKLMKPRKPSKRSQGKVIRCGRCGCTGKTLIGYGLNFYICRDCLAKEEKRNAKQNRL